MDYYFVFFFFYSTKCVENFRDFKWWRIVLKKKKFLKKPNLLDTLQILTNGKQLILQKKVRRYEKNIIIIMKTSSTVKMATLICISSGYIMQFTGGNV